MEEIPVVIVKVGLKKSTRSRHWMNHGRCRSRTNEIDDDYGLHPWYLKAIERMD